MVKWSVVAGAAMLTLTATLAAAEPVRLIFDTDICGDVDDVLALGMIHAMESRGACKLVCVTVSAEHEQAAPFVDAVNTFYGRPDVPVGAVRDGVKPGDSKYLHLARQRDGNRLRYPHNLATARDAPEAWELLRKTLAEQPDGSAVIAQVGFSTNLARLLQSASDEYSRESGVELVRRKVKLLSVMAGSFQTIEGHKRFLEYNVVQDIDSARVLAEKWPTPVVYSGFEIGISLPFPAASIERDFGYVEHHPLVEEKPG